MIFRFAILSLLLVPAIAVAKTVIPDCLEGSQVLQVNNEQVLQWKVSSPNGVKRRAHVAGVVTRSFNDRTGHAHFEISIGKRHSDTLEVIFNKNFDQLPQIREYMNIEACGDYITANKPNGGYPPSPSGAIIHWIHRSDNVAKHDHGYLAIDGELYGYGRGRPNPHHVPDSFPYINVMPWQPAQ